MTVKIALGIGGQFLTKHELMKRMFVQSGDRVRSELLNQQLNGAGKTSSCAV
jgi:hypothetical protein